MVRFTVKLADVPVGISALYEKTRALYREYLTDAPPHFSLEVTERALREEREMLARRAAPDRLCDIASPEALEDQWLYRQIGERLPEYGALLFHGSAVAVDGAAYLFTAPSGTGKSTHTRLWRRVFGDRAVMINDDKPLLKFDGSAVLVCGSPWMGKHRLGTNAAVPLKGLCLLNRDICNSIRPVSGGEAFPTLLMQCYRPEDAQRTALTLALLERLAQTVPIYRLGCNTEPEAAGIAFTGMNGGIKP